MDRTVRIFEPSTGREVLALRDFQAAAQALALSPNGRRLATGGADGSLRLFDMASGAEVLALRAHEGAVSGVAFAGAGPRLATSSTDGSVRVFDLAAIERFLARPAEEIAAESEERTGLRLEDAELVPIPQGRLFPGS